jgi:hypothetical protein
LNRSIAGWPLESLQAAAREWWDWNSTRAWNPDGLDILFDSVGIDLDFAEELDARQFMNAVYDRLIVSVRAMAGKDWRPDANQQQANSGRG